MLHQDVGKCPEVTVRLGSHPVRCLLDTGAQVSTITESFFKEQIAREEDLVDVSAFIRITGGHGLEIPYLGYIELTLQVADRQFPNMGFLVVKDPVDGEMQARKKKVPGVIGSNIFRDIQNSVGSAKQGTCPDPTLGPILALYEEAQAEKSREVPSGVVRVAGKKPILVPARSLKVLEATTRPAEKDQPYCAIVEESMVFTGPQGLLLVEPL